MVARGWALSLLSDRRVRLRRTGFEGPLALFAVAVAGSIAFNVDRIAARQPAGRRRQARDVLRVVRAGARARRRASSGRSARLDTIVRILVVGGTIVAAFALYEARTGYNYFDHLNQWIPCLQTADVLDVPGRGARIRVYASAQHPIALGAALAMLLPLAIYLAQTQRRRIWYACLIVLAVGVLATVSRTVDRDAGRGGGDLPLARARARPAGCGRR